MTSKNAPTRPQLSSSSGLRHSRILGVGGYRPQRVVNNAEICEFIDSSDEWIQQRSGIVERRWASDDETIVEMAHAAAMDALEMAGIEVSQLSGIIVATVTHGYQTPGAAPMLAARMGIPSVPAFDISAACAGYCYATSLANDMIRVGTADHVLIVGVERLTDYLDRTDRGSAFIFGDGAGAAVVGPSDYPGIGPTIWGSDGDSWGTIRNKQSWSDLKKEVEQGLPGQWPWLQMEGQAVFRWAVYSMAPVAKKALAAAGVSAEDLDAFIPHQANMRITDAMVKAIGLPDHVAVARDIAYTGNTSAASVPLATTRMLESGEAPRGGLALQIGFGAGLVYAAQVVILP